jgi:hypothetical protein
MVDTLVLFAALAAGVRLAGDWCVSAGATELNIVPLTMTEAAAERRESLPEFDFPSRQGRRRGARLVGVFAEECTVNGALDPASVVVRSGERVFRRGVDYAVDSDWGTIGRVPGGAIAEGQPVPVSYRYAPPAHRFVRPHARRQD